MSSAQSLKRTLSGIGHSGSFKVILTGVGRNPERGVVVMYNNVDLISKTFEGIATGKLQIRRFQPPHYGLTRIVQQKPSNIYNQFILPET